MLTVLTWLWGTKYPFSHVEKLRAGVARHLKQPHRFVCVTNNDIPGDRIPIEDVGLLAFRDGCYARLRQFDPAWQERHGIERLVCLDLDVVVTGELDPLFDWPDPFMILHGGHYNPCPFNGSVMMVARGARSEIWTTFDLDLAEKIATADGQWRGTDQTWIAHCAPDAPGWTHWDGIYALRKPGWTGNDQDLPADARLVAFPGAKDPSRLDGLWWVKKHWVI